MSFLEAHPLSKFPEHSEIVGSILLAYGEIEANLLGHVKLAVGDLDTALRLLYRVRSEAHRLDIADAVLRPFYSAIGLRNTYAQWFGAMKWCKKARNQYAHCLWDPRPRTDPAFANLELSASSAEGATMMKFHAVTLKLLKEQQKFFGYTEELMWHLQQEGTFRKDRRRTRRRTPKPKALPLPPLDSLEG